MNGKLGLGMAIPEDATAALGPLPTLPTGARQAGREFEVRLHCFALYRKPVGFTRSPA